MRKGVVLYSLRRMSLEERHAFNRWLKANVVVGSIFAAGLVAMALLGSKSTGPADTAIENNMQHRDISVAAVPSE